MARDGKDFWAWLRSDLVYIPLWFMKANLPYSQSHSVFHIHGIFWQLLVNRPPWNMQSFGFMTVARTRFSENLYQATFWPSRGYPSVQMTSWFWLFHEIGRGDFSRLKMIMVKYAIFHLLLTTMFKNMVQAIFQLLLKKLIPALSGIADGRLREMYSQQRHVTRRYIDFMPFPSLPISHLYMWYRWRFGIEMTKNGKLYLFWRPANRPQQ